MSLKLVPALFRTPPEVLENLPRETFLGIIGEIHFLRAAVLILLLVCGVLAAGLAVKRGSREPGMLVVDHPRGVTYAEAEQGSVNIVGRVCELRQESGGSSPAGPAHPARTALPQGDAPVPDTALTPLSGPIISSAAVENPPDAAGAASKPEKPALWVLMETLNEDPRRELLEKRFAAGNVEIVFMQANPDGIIGFELVNKGNRPIYLPYLDVPDSDFRVHLERRVLEEGSRSAGILQVPGSGRRKTLNLAFGAANLKSVPIILEVPSW